MKLFLTLAIALSGRYTYAQTIFTGNKTDIDLKTRREIFLFCRSPISLERLTNCRIISGNTVYTIMPQGLIEIYQ